MQETPQVGMLVEDWSGKGIITEINQDVCFFTLLNGNEKYATKFDIDFVAEADTTLAKLFNDVVIAIQKYYTELDNVGKGGLSCQKEEN